MSFCLFVFFCFLFLFSVLILNIFRSATQGVPPCGNNLKMNSIARDEWGFDGFIISDSGAIPDDAFAAYGKDANLGDSTYDICREY